MAIIKQVQVGSTTYDVAVTAGVGLAGGSAANSGTVKAKLKSETKLTNAATAAATETANSVYPVAVDKDGYLAVNVPSKNAQLQQVHEFFITESSYQDSYTLENYDYGDTVLVHVSGYKVPATEVSISESGVLTLMNAPEIAGTEVEVTIFKMVEVNAAIKVVDIDNKMGWYRQATAPSNINAMWVDTSVTPNIIKFYNGVE